MGLIKVPKNFLEAFIKETVPWFKSRQKYIYVLHLSKRQGLQRKNRSQGRVLLGKLQQQQFMFPVGRPVVTVVFRKSSYKKIFVSGFFRHWTPEISGGLLRFTKRRKHYLLQTRRSSYQTEGCSKCTSLRCRKKFTPKGYRNLSLHGKSLPKCRSQRSNGFPMVGTKNKFVFTLYNLYIYSYGLK